MSGETGISTDDFFQIYNDFYRTVSYQANTKTVDGMGNETSTFATATDVNLIYFKEDCRYLFDKEGLLQVGDSYILAKTTVGIQRYDRFTIDNISYYIENVIRRYVMGTAMFDYAVCYIVSAPAEGP
jgi:uncharacterized protein YllA (UPF0747 family)